MKLAGMAGVGSGKLGSMVYSVRNGEQIVRQYNPVVNNPQTDAQVAARSRLKLMSQLAAILAPVIAIPAEGLKSKRNLFISRNYDLSYYANGAAQINLAQVQLTKSSVSLPELTVTRDAETGISAKLAADSHNNFDRVYYVCIVKMSDGSFSLHDGKVATNAGANGDFPVVMGYTASPICVYAYAIRANDAATLTRFDAITTDANLAIASVLSRSRDVLDNITYSITRGVVLGNGSDSGSADPSKGQVTVVANPSNGGTVSGGGAFDLGAEVTVTATAGNGYVFNGWYINNQRVSTAASYKFTCSGNTNLVAKFEDDIITD